MAASPWRLGPPWHGCACVFMSHEHCVQQHWASICAAAVLLGFARVCMHATGTCRIAQVFLLSVLVRVGLEWWCMGCPRAHQLACACRHLDLPDPCTACLHSSLSSYHNPGLCAVMCVSCVAVDERGLLPEMHGSAVSCASFRWTRGLQPGPHSPFLFLPLACVPGTHAVSPAAPLLSLSCSLSALPSTVCLCWWLSGGLPVTRWQH